MFGIITIALGEQRYIEMAKMLALSLMQTNPAIPRAIITDADEKVFANYYDIQIPHNKKLGKGLLNKLYLNEYSPFEETLFIDADCLAVKPLHNTLTLCSKFPFVVFGDQINSGYWSMDVPYILQQFNLNSLPCFNGGTYYFKKTEVTTNIYKKARELNKDYEKLGLEPFRGAINEELIISIAMAINNIEAVNDKGIGMRTPIGIIGALKIDVLNEECLFNKEGEMVEPAVMHFAGSYADAFHYKRETAKLKVKHSLPFLNKKLISVSVNVVYNVPYALYVFLKRISKIILKREKFDFTVALPIFSNQ